MVWMIRKGQDEGSFRRSIYCLVTRQAIAAGRPRECYVMAGLAARLEAGHPNNYLEDEWFVEVPVFNVLKTRE